MGYKAMHNSAFMHSRSFLVCLEGYLLNAEQLSTLSAAGEGQSVPLVPKNGCWAVISTCFGVQPRHVHHSLQQSQHCLNNVLKGLQRASP